MYWYQSLLFQTFEDEILGRIGTIKKPCTGQRLKFKSKTQQLAYTIAQACRNLSQDELGVANHHGSTISSWKPCITLLSNLGYFSEKIKKMENNEPSS